MSAIISGNFIMIAAVGWEHVNIMTVMSASIAYKCWRDDGLAPNAGVDSPKPPPKDCFQAGCCRMLR